MVYVELADRCCGCVGKLCCNCGETPCPDDEDDPPVQCWHTEPGTPCDWDVCRQPERLAAGDRGVDPADQ